MKRVSKNLTKAVTLSLLLMLPYGMVEARIYDRPIGGTYDNYAMTHKPGGGPREPIATSDRNKTTYDFGEEETTLKITIDQFKKHHGIEISSGSGAIKNREIIIANKLNIILTQDAEKPSYRGDGISFSTNSINNLINRKYGGDLTIDDGTSGVTLKNAGNVLYGGKGNITVTGNNYYGYTYGINIGEDAKNAAVYWGEGTISATTDKGRDRERVVAAINMSQDMDSSIYVLDNRKVILGIKTVEEYTEGNLSKYDNISVDDFSKLVNELGEVTLTATAKNLSKTNKKDVEANGVSGANGTNTIVSGITTINATAFNEAGYKEDITTEANGLKFNNYGTALFQKADITAIAESKNGNDVVANGIKVNVEGNDTQNHIITTYLDKSSVIEATATGTGTVQAHGIYSIKSGKSTTKAENSLSANGIEITTTTNGGTDVENVGIKASGGTVNIIGTAKITAVANGLADKENNAVANDLADKENNKVYGLWSTNGGNINVNGTTNISTSGGQEIAVVAGTENWTDVEDNPDGGTNNINLNYGVGSEITGDIISGYGGNIVIGTPESTEGGISTLSARNNSGTLTLNGDALAGNGGTLNINLTAGSTWTGRADDYQDADLKNWKDEHEEQFNPKFSNSIAASGDVNVTLAQGAKWNVTGQSWITELDGNGVVDLTKGKGSDAVHIGKVKGKNTFVVNLKPGELGASDMIYVQDGTSKAQTLQINNRDEVLSGMKAGDALRFATVNKAGEGFGNITDGAETFGKSTTINDAGIFNVDFDIIYKDYNEKMEGDLGTDQTYNGGNFSTNKPGQDYVDNVYGGKKDTSEINTLEETTETESNPKHVYLVRKENSAENKSDAGKTIINMSRANYKNAIYMDRLNKRMGEMRYVNGEEGQGLWVRLRHDRIGQSGDFRSMNTMYEVGYDVKQPTDNGEHRIGMAIDYMRGSTTYDDIMGKGETKRYGLWLYDTWLGEKGHYVDYVAKWGHLSNDFDITAKTTGEKINGDYSNNVFSVSAEYGKKNDMGNNWYFEPQAQLQLARVTGADYVTTQGSKVNVDGINSLIGRAGFRIGRDMDENSTVYLKADLLHEFMGDQMVTAADATGTLREEFENKGTWYDVGFGFAAKMSKNSYAFMDFEKSFGNDNDETYQINAGMQWSF